MGTHEKLVPGELLVELPGMKCRVEKKFKTNMQIIKNYLIKNINEEIAHV